MEYRVCRNNPAPYNDLNGKISLLGLGTMRLPLRDAADQTSIDEEKAQEIYPIRRGGNVTCGASQSADGRKDLFPRFFYQ